LVPALSITILALPTTTALIRRLPMIEMLDVQFDDVASIAAIHCASWRSTYRGVLRDDFLDGDLLANRLALWHQRLASAADSFFGVIAWQDGQPVGFSFGYPLADPVFGHLVDNLHVLPQMKGQGLGRRLLQAMAARCQARGDGAGMFLWVYENNTAAIRFYQSLGARPCERQVAEVPGGGMAAEWRYAWDSPALLLAHLAGGGAVSAQV
jgi:ribosomal protein S18 acetylase RimI-like enzyme